MYKGPIINCYKITNKVLHTYRHINQLNNMNHLYIHVMTFFLLYICTVLYIITHKILKVHAGS